MTMAQPTVTTEKTSGSSPDPAACISLDVLREYLSGWSHDLQSERIEFHLAMCPACEQALRNLEVKPDTLMQSLQQTAVDTSRTHGDDALGKSGDSPVEAALAMARRLMDVASETSKPAWRPANREFGIYELLRPLGRGGMGAVYLATHRQLNKQVAIKLLPVMSAEDSDVRARFQREIRVVGRLNHPSIVAATDAGEINGTQFLVMEYVPGLDLSRLARLLGKLPVADACELMRQVALGLSCAHADGVVHRDVKPSNLMLDEAGRVKILDFGLAQLSVWDEASVDLTTVGQLMGTLDYMAPEQAELSGGVDYRADLYAMGATLFRLLCGRPPLAAAPNQSPLEKLRMLASHQPPKLDTLCPEAPVELVALVGSLLARSPQDRPASAAHVAEQFAVFSHSANLVGLLNLAKEKEAQWPEMLKKSEKPGFFEKPGFYAANSSAAKVDSDDGNRDRIRRWIIAAAALPLVIVAGILIRLEVEKGQLVIESEVDNIKVRLVSDGKHVSGLTINHGTTATRLRADKYEIVIDGPSDGLAIDNNHFTIQNRETVVARIHIEPLADSVVPPMVGGTIPGATVVNPRIAPLNVPGEMVLKLNNEPLYDGKTLSEWLEMLSREKSPAGLKSAFDACRALASPETSVRITQTLVSVLPGLDGELNLTPGRESSSYTLDHEAVKVLWKANPGSAFYTLWVSQFETADQNWRDRLWWYSLYGAHSKAETIEPFVAWAEGRLSRAPTDTKSVDAETVKAADYLRSFSPRFADNQPAIDRIFTALKGSPHLGTPWWLSQPLVYRSSDSNNRSSSDSNIWPPAIKSEITRVAIETLQSADASPSLVAQACMILANGAALNEEQRTLVLAALNRRLVAACSTPETMTEMVTTVDSFAGFSTPDIAKASHFSPLPVQIVLGGDDSRACVVLELLDVVKGLDGVASAKEGLDTLAQGTKDTLELINGVRAVLQPNNRDRRTGPQGNPFAVALSWPDLTDSDGGISRQNFGSGTSVPGSGALATQQLWGKHQPTAQDWLKYCMLLHPAMAESVAAMTKQAEVDMLPAESPQGQPESGTPLPSDSDESIYEGKTLQQWLDVIAKERSPDQFLAALKACSALLTPEAGTKVTQVFLKTLPKINGVETIQIAENTNGTIDFAAFGVIAKAIPGRAYFEMLAEQYQSPDLAWRKRLTTNLWQGDSSKFENVEPLVTWAEKELREPSESPLLQSANDAALILRIYVEKFPENEAFTESALNALRNSQSLGTDWWLALPMPPAVESSTGAAGDALNEQPTIPYAVWPAALFPDVMKRAITDLENPASSPSHVAQASMILTNAVGLTDEQTEHIVAAVNRRLTELAKSNESMTELIDVESAFVALSVPARTDDPWHINWSYETRNPAKACVALELLDLFQKLKGDGTPQDGVASVADVLIDVPPPGSDRERLWFNWPTLQNTGPASFSPNRRKGNDVNEVTPEGLMRFVIDSHPAVIEYRATAAKPGSR